MHVRIVHPVALALVVAACTGREQASAVPPPSSFSKNGAPVASTAPPAKMAADALPAYDVAEDRERRARAARVELGPKTIATVVSDVFVVIGPPPKKSAPQLAPGEVRAQVQSLIDEGTPRMDAIKSVAKSLGIPKRDVYRLMEV